MKSFFFKGLEVMVVRPTFAQIFEFLDMYFVEKNFKAYGNNFILPKLMQYSGREE